MTALTTAILGAMALLVGGLAYYRRKAAGADADRARLRDTLTLIDTKKELERLDKEVKDAEQARLEARRNYDSNVWRPADPHDGPSTD